MCCTKSKVNCFYSICESLIKKFGNPLTADFAYTYISNYAPDGDDLFMWIANAKHEIGVQPVHYEIRVVEGRIFVELHVESENPNKNGSAVVIQLVGVLNVLYNNGNIIPTKSTQNNYFWYRLNNDKSFNIDDSEKNVEEIFKELQELDKVVGETIRDVIENEI